MTALSASHSLTSNVERLKGKANKYAIYGVVIAIGAIAMAGAPKVIIADEPTTALDVTIQLQYLRLLKEIQKNTGLAIIFITHDFGIVARMCDRVAVMYAGRIVESADVRSLFNSPTHPYTQALIASVPQMDRTDRLFAIEGQPPALPIGSVPAEGLGTYEAFAHSARFDPSTGSGSRAESRDRLRVIPREIEGRTYSLRT